MGPNDADGMANSVDPDQTGSALFAQAYLSENLGSLCYIVTSPPNLCLSGCPDFTLYRIA